MKGEGFLVAGQVIRYGPALYRVDYVNECRARIIPLAKRHVTLADGREFDAERTGISIAPNAYVEIVTDLDRARTELELAEVEKELAETRRALAAKDAPPPAPAARPAAKTAAPPRVPRGGGWHAVQPGTFKPGSLADQVMTFIVANPGLDTAAIVAGVKAEGAVAACVSRFNQAGLITKR